VQQLKSAMRIGILGGGVAGLSAAYFLRNTDHEVELFEASDFTGGLARSFEWHDFWCDLAPHRLHTDDPALLEEMKELTPMNQVRRYSKIFIRKKWIGDPVNAVEIMVKFFPIQAMRIALTYLRTKFQRNLPENNFEELVISQFGTGLNDFFFKPYSEKLFGIPANQISAAWGRRKIRVAGVKDMIQRQSRLYFKTFHYPKQRGYGAICEAVHEKVKDTLNLETKLVAIEHPKNDSDTYKCTFEGPDGKTFVKEFDTLITTLPVSSFADMMGLDLDLGFRPARLVYLLIDKPQLSENHWFYFADNKRIVNRVAEFKNFQCEGGQPDKTVICCEVTMIEDYSLEAVYECLEEANLADRSQVLDTKIIDIEHAYPVYDTTYEVQMEKVKTFFDKHPRVHHVGRHAEFAHRDIDEIFEEAKRIGEKIEGATKS